MIGGDMDKPSNERGSTGPTDGIKAEGDAGNERHICKANPAMIDDIGKNMAWKIRQKIFPARNMLWHRKQLPNSLRRVDAMWLWAKPDACYGGWDYCCFHQHLFCGRNGAPMAMMIL